MDYEGSAGVLLAMESQQAAKVMHLGLKCGAFGRGVKGWRGLVQEYWTSFWRFEGWETFG